MRRVTVKGMSATGREGEKGLSAVMNLLMGSII